jgi:mRNA-degrading endonuclease RelE of RelBE toxin-antitoxin system
VRDVEEVAVAFAISFAASVAEQLDQLQARERVIVLAAIERQLMHEPLVETRHRKPLRPNRLAPWELRVGPLRVFYEVVPVEPDVVRVLAIGKKYRNVLRIGGREITP